MRRLLVILAGVILGFSEVMDPGWVHAVLRAVGRL